MLGIDRIFLTIIIQYYATLFEILFQSDIAIFVRRLLFVRETDAQRLPRIIYYGIHSDTIAAMALGAQLSGIDFSRVRHLIVRELG